LALAAEDDNSDDSDDSDSESDEEDEGSDFEIDEQFKSELKKSLGEAAVTSDDESGSEDSDGLDMDTVDPKLMDDMDKALASVFKQRQSIKTTKRKQMDMRQSVVHFKLRVLDLIEIFIRAEAANPLVLCLVNGLIDVQRYSEQNQEERVLVERTHGIYKNKLCALKTYPASGEMDVEAVHGQIESLFSYSKASQSVEMATNVAIGVSYLTRVLRGTPDLKKPSPLKTRGKRKSLAVTAEITKTSFPDCGCLDEARVLGLYETAMVDFMTRRSSNVQPVIFTELTNKFPSLAWQMAVQLPKYLNTACNNFRKMKACELLSSLLAKNAHTEATVEALHKDLIDQLIQVFTTASADECTMKSRNLNELLHLCTAFLRTCRKLAAQSVWPALQKDELTAALEKLSKGQIANRSQNVQSVIKSAISLIAQPIDGKKQKKPRKK